VVIVLDANNRFSRDMVARVIGGSFALDNHNIQSRGGRLLRMCQRNGILANEDVDQDYRERFYSILHTKCHR
jgi:hypothetical protein